MMKQIFNLLFCVAALTALFSCSGKKKKIEVPPAQIVPVKELPTIVEARGRIGDGSSMNVLQLVQVNGDTLDILAPNQMVMGGMVVGNDVDVVYSMIEESPVAQIAINMTALQHLWTQRSAGGHLQSLELDSRGRATTYDMGITYNQWSIQDGFLLLHAPKAVGDESPVVVDTFQIMMLTEDSLVLMAPNAPVASAFYRDN